MKTLRSPLRARQVLLVLSGLLFLFLLLLNFLTAYIADDYVYLFSFYTKDYIHSLSDLVKSMYQHCLSMNGRVVSHTLEQLFLLAPKAVFNVVNALVYTGFMLLLYHIANYRKKTNVLLFLLIVAAFWYFMPVYGQVVLWQVGALNYLWGLVVGVLFLYPYLRRFLALPPRPARPVTRVLFCLFALPAGMYTEVTSFIAIALAALLLLLPAVRKAQPLRCWLWLPLLFACVGYLILLSIPAELSAKQGELSLAALLARCNTATATLYQTLLLPLLVWACLFALAVFFRLEPSRIQLSGLLAFGAVAANYMLIMASYYPQRCACTSACLLVLAIAVLAADMPGTRLEAVWHPGLAALAVVASFSLLLGTYDIWQCHVSFSLRETHIAAAVEQGETDLTLPLITPSTKYSAYWDTKDLDTADPAMWPNSSMARYYGVDSILGY